MLEQFRSHRIWALPAAASAVGGLALTLWAPTLVRERISALARERAGLEAVVGDVSLGLGSVELRGLTFAPASKAKGVSLQVDRVHVDAGPFGLLLRGTRAASVIQVQGVRASVDTESPGYEQLRAKLRAPNEAPKSSSPASTARKVDVTQVAFSVKRGNASSFEGGGGELHLDGVTLRAGFPTITANAAERGSARLTGVQLEASKREGWQVEKVSVAVATLRAPAKPALDTSPAAAKASAAGEPEPDPGDVAPPPRPAITPTSPGTSVKPATPAASPFAAFMARLAPGAELSVQRGSFAQGDETVMNELSGRVQVLSASELHVTGSGVAQAGGHLEADMRVSPVDLRADGKIVLEKLPLTLLVPILPNVPWVDPEQSRIDAELSVKTESLERLAIAGRASIENGAVFSPRLAPTTVHVADAEVEGNGYWFPLRRRLEIEKAQLRSKKAKVALAGVLERTADHYVIELDASLPRTACTEAVRALPEDLLAELAIATWTGTLSGRVQVAIDSRQLEKTKLDIDVRDQCEFAALPEMADLRRFAQPFVHSVVEPDDTIFEMETGPGTEAWTPIEAISPFFIYAVLAHEDPQFFAHHGFSPLHIKQALIRNLQEGRYVVGASTITMQLVKNVFLRREKTLARKLQEVLLTWWLERAMDKREILQLYLNVIEYGPSIYGVRNAAKHYFNRLPSELSPAESVFLATILPNPKKFHVYFEKGALSPSWASNMRKLMQRMRERGFYDAAAVEYGMHEIDAFKFVPEGGAAPPRIVPGATAPLPFSAQAPLGDVDDEAPIDAAPDGFD